MCIRDSQKYIPALLYSRSIIHIGIHMPPLGCAVEKPAARVLFTHLLKGLVLTEVKLRPIIQSRTAHLLLAYIKAQGVHQVQSRSRHAAGSGNIPCVGWDFGLNQYLSFIHI